MQIKEKYMVPLGYGKFVRSDKIVSIEPIEDERGPGRRTKVYIEDMKLPLIASRTDHTSLAYVVETPKQELEAAAAFELLKDIYNDILQIGPMLRKSIKKEANFDIDKIEKRINEILRHEIGVDEIQ